MRGFTVAVVLTLVSVLIIGCNRAAEPSTPEGQSLNWKVKILSATRGPRKDSTTSPASTDTLLNIEVAVEYLGQEKDAPFSKASVTLDGKELKFVSFAGNIMERMQGNKFNETYSYEDPGADPAGSSRQFSLKYADVPAIAFKLMEKKPINSNR
jgi:hypothetical protein